jgi:hypothetical protein
MRWIYISPHFDDAILSCGGLIDYQTSIGLSVEVWTVTSGIPQLEGSSDLIKQIQEQWNVTSPAEAVIERKKEDNLALGLVNATSSHLNYLDCIYRASREGNFYYQSIFSDIHPEEANLPLQISNLINQQIQDEDILVFPLSIGNHIDHEIVNEAAKFIPNKKLFFIDIPYFFKDEEILETIKNNYIEKNILFPPNHIVNWVKGILLYKSQVSSLFLNEKDVDEKITRFYSRFNGLSLWEECTT